MGKTPPNTDRLWENVYTELSMFLEAKYENKMAEQKTILHCSFTPR